MYQSDWLLDNLLLERGPLSTSWPQYHFHLNRPLLSLNLLSVSHREATVVLGLTGHTVTVPSSMALVYCVHSTSGIRVSKKLQ